MTVSRLLFLAKYRVPHACFSLQFDSYIQGIDKTIIATPLSRDELEPVWAKYNIDSSKFEYINDAVIFEKYPEVNNWVFPDDYRGWWLRQQAIKLSYRDFLDDDVTLMYDPDTFMIEPYRCYNPETEELNLMTLLNTVQGSYNGVFESITGIPHPSPHCFVTELVPVRKKDWVALKQLLKQRWPNKHWLDSIIDAVPGMPTIPPWGNGNIIKWFSEYELLGNWAVLQGNVKYQEQRRFEYSTLDNIGNFDLKFHNAVCDAIPNLNLSMQLDWDTLEINNFDRWFDTVQQVIDEAKH